MIKSRIYKKLIIDEKEFSEGVFIDLILKDGRNVSGTICEITDNTVTLKADDITFYQINIRKISKRLTQ